MQNRGEVRRKSKGFRRRVIWLIISMVLLFSIVGAIWFWNSNKRTIIGKKLEKSIRKRTDSLYTISYDSLGMNEIAGNMTIKNMHVHTDSSQVISLTKTNKIPSVLMELKVPFINFTGLKTPRAMLNNELVAKKLEIVNPRLTMRYTGSKYEKYPHEQLYEMILGDLDLLQADTILITGGQVTTISQESGKTILTVEDLSASFLNVKVDSASQEDKVRTLFAKSFSMQARKTSWSSPNDFYKFSLENVNLNSLQTEATIGRFSITPAYPEDVFVSKQTYQNDRFDFYSSKIKFTGLDIRKLMENELVASELVISSASCKIYRDLSKQRDKKNRAGYDAIIGKDDQNFHVGIKNVNISNSYFEYREKVVATHEIGKISFHQLNATIKNFSNKRNPNSEPMSLLLDARFLNKTPISLNWDFYLFDPLARFDLKGHTGSLDAKDLNPFTEPEAMAHIREGYINGLNFDLTGNSNTVKGNVKLLYTDLQLDILEKDAGSQKKDKKFLTSIFANIRTRNSNPKGNDPPREANVMITRDPNFSLFSASWKAIAAGISEITGVPLK